MRYTSKTFRTLQKQRRVAILLLFLGGSWGPISALKKATISAAAQISAEILNFQAGHTAAG